ncbi:hypothetical protein QUF74_01420 [Candidatus Halobeggiatoa sp. HSG11]|nr:hypothetical protein [Candidatus Halobeggiatoa sp. HSG11]
MSNIKRFKVQTNLLEDGAEELQRHIARLDEILAKIKTACVTVWVAVIGWAFTTNNSSIVILGAILLLGFWLLEGFVRGIQSRYLHSSAKLTKFFNDREAMDQAFEKLEYPPGVVYPMTFKESEWQKLKMYLQGLAAVSTIILYAFLGFANYLVWVFI